ncbi:MAG: c-type cytochrome [Candidatus Eisenbacteria bacterium]
MRRLLPALVAIAVVAGLVTVWWTRPRPTAAERGRRLAGELGCFACHGPGGIRGASNPGRKDRTVPTFEGDVMMYADDAAGIRAWIRDGVTPKRRVSETWKRERDAGVLRMPAFGHRVSEHELDDLVAFVVVSSDHPEPADSLVKFGRERVSALGCTGCHGAGGRFALPNPGSLKGYVPSWDGPDFPELVRDRTEFEQWVRDGRSRRFRAQPMAGVFLDRAVLHMPAFERHLAPGDLDALWAYVTWLRTPAANPGTGR